MVERIQNRVMQVTVEGCALPLSPSEVTPEIFEVDSGEKLGILKTGLVMPGGSKVSCTAARKSPGVLLWRRRFILVGLDRAPQASVRT